MTMWYGSKRLPTVIAIFIRDNIVVYKLLNEMYRFYQ